MGGWELEVETRSWQWGGRKGSTNMAGKACLGKADPCVEGPGTLLGLLQTLSNGVRLLVHCQ